MGVSLLGISEAAEAIGLHSIGAKMEIEQLKEIVQEAPVILHWKENHFVVVYKSPKPRKTGTFYVADPAAGLISYTEEEFREQWIGMHPEAAKEFENYTGGKTNQQIGCCSLLNLLLPFMMNHRRTG